MAKATKKILLIEDDQFTLELYEEILKENGYQVTTSADGEEGLKLIKKGGYNLILLDIMLPQLDGVEILSAVQKTNKTPIIILTNLANDSLNKKAKDFGAVDFLIKSNIAPDELIKKIKAHL